MISQIFLCFIVYSAISNVIYNAKGQILMKIHIIGAGALGLLFASKLAKSGVDVQLFTRTEEQARAIRQQGIQLNTGMGASEQVAVQVAKWGEQIEPAAWTLVMLKQKSFTPAFAAQLYAHLGERGKVCCFQNGIGHVELLQQHFKIEQIYSAVTTEGARRDDSTGIAHTGTGQTQIGSFQSTMAGAEQNDLVQALAQAGFHAALSKNIEVDVYRKLLVNAIINPLTAIWRIPNGELLRTPERMRVMRGIYEETRLIYRNFSIPVTEDWWDYTIQVCRNTAENTSSMLKDILYGVETEIEWINGGIVRMAEKAGLKSPMNQMLYELICAAHTTSNE